MLINLIMKVAKSLSTCALFLGCLTVSLSGFARSHLWPIDYVPMLDDIPEAHIEDWYGERQARTSISRGNSPTTVVLADDLDLSNRSYSFTTGNCPKNVIIIANTIRLSAATSFNLNPAEGPTVEDRSGGTLVILARTFRFENNAFIYFNGIPTYFIGGNINDVNRYDFRTAPTSGSVYLSCEKLVLSSTLRDQVIANILNSVPDLLPDKVGEPLRPDVKSSLLMLASKAYSDPSIRDAVANLIRSKTVFDNDLIDIALYLKARSVDEDIAKHGADIVVRTLLSAQLEDPNNLKFSIIARPTPGQILGADRFNDLYPRFPPLKRSVSRWALRWYSNKLSQASTAMLHNNKAQLYDIYDAIEHFPSYTIDANDDTAYQDVLHKLSDLREKAKLTLYSKSVTINLGGADVNIDVFGENNSTRLSIMPTNVLVQDATFEGQRYAGILNFTPSSPNELTFYVTGLLSLDPQIAAAVSKSLAATNQRLSGQFSNWRVKSVTFGDVPGLIREKSSVVISGSTLRASLVFETDSLGALGLVIFSSQAGVPVNISWEYTPDPSYEGTLTTLSISRATRATPAILYSNGSLSNGEKYPVKVMYVKNGVSNFIRFATAIPTIQPNASETLPLPNGVNPKNVSIPPEAIELSYEKPREYLDFYPLHGEQLAEDVLLQNEIGPADAAHPSRLLIRIDISVTYGTDDPTFKQTWNTSLAPSGLPGAQQVRWFLRPKQANAVITIQGKAFYSDNSTVDIPPKTFNTTIIHVTGDLLNSQGVQ